MQRGKHQRGFTFVEIIIALSLLAIAAGLLIGLQSAAVQRTLRDRSAQQAMLAARRIMASIEANADKLQISDQSNEPLSAVLQTLGAPAPSATDNKQELDNLRVSLQFVDWDLPLENIENPAMRKVILTISWSDAPQDSFKIDYLMASGPKEDA